MTRQSAAWSFLFDELVMDRLRQRRSLGWMREMRRRNLVSEDMPAGENEAEDVEPDEAEDVEPDVGSATAGVGDEEEGRAMKGPTTPYVPTEKERKEHNLTHYPHRSWCEICMGGRAIAGRHSPCPDEGDSRAGEFHFDYCFLNNEVREEAAVTLVGVDKSTDAVLAHVVPEKGTRFDWVAQRLDRDVRRFGYHGRIVVKSDGENSARDLTNELARRRREDPTVIEVSKPYDSKSNSRAEGAVRRMECQIRT